MIFSYSHYWTGTISSSALTSHTKIENDLAKLKINLTDMLPSPHNIIFKKEILA